MPDIQLSFKHGRTLDDARAHLAAAVQAVQGQFGLMVQRAEWSPDRNQVFLAGPGFEIQMRVDPTDVHVTGDVPLLGKLLGGPIATGLKGVVRQAFEKQLPKK